MEESRTKNTIRNVKSGAIVQIVNKVMAFIVQTVFIRTLNTEYLGINGLFTNILTILSFTELGIGTAIIYNMYKPVAENDKDKIKGLMKLYKKSYNIIGIIVFLLGLCVIPFMNLIIKDAPNVKENLVFIYLLFLLNTVISYFFTYKKSIIYAYQKQSIIDNIDSIVYFIKSIILVAFLILTKNFVVYLIIQVLTTLIENIIISIKVNKLYPYLKEKNVKDLDKTEKRSIFSNVKSLVIYKFGEVCMKGTDNILISTLVNVDTVGLCSNYILIINSIKSIIFSTLNGVTASVGNLNAVGEPKQKENVFYQITFVNYIIFSFLAIAFIVLLNPFISIWLGQDYTLEIGVSVALAVSCFIEGLRNPACTYRVTLGLFEKGRITPYVGAISNIVLSIVLCKLFGVVGIFMATAIAQLISYSCIDPYLIHKYGFKTSSSKYFKRFTIYIGIFIINTVISLKLASFIRVNMILDFTLKAIIVCVVPNVINLIIFNKTEELRELKLKLVKEK